MNRGIKSKEFVDVNQLSIEFSNISGIDADLEYYNTSDAFPTTNRMIQPNFEFSNVTQNDAVESILGVRSNSIGSDGIDPKFIKLIFPYILRYITYLLNTILTSSTLATMWKSANIIPVPKQDKTYRPIAIFIYRNFSRN